MGFVLHLKFRIYQVFSGDYVKFRIYQIFSGVHVKFRCLIGLTHCPHLPDLLSDRQERDFDSSVEW